MKLEHVIEGLRTIAPERLAESWDKVGLHVGDPAWNVRRAMLCIDLTEAVMAEARAAKADLVVAYHPPIFKPLDALTTADVKQRIILEAAMLRVAVYSPHTALDAAAGGVNDFLAAACDPKAEAVRPIRRHQSAASHEVKLVTFLPADDVDRVRSALSRAGAGRIGDYDQCSFTLAGEGTFRGSPSTNPAVGKADKFERVAELRLEMVCPAGALPDAVAALRDAHPYEEPAFDIYPLETPPPAPTDDAVGQGRIVTLSKPTPLRTVIGRLKKALGLKHLDVGADDLAASVRTIGLCAGAGGSLLDEAGDIDAFFTGEMRHHDVLAARARGVSVILAGHTQTERPFLPAYRERIEAAVGNGVTLKISEYDRPPSTIR